MVGLTKCLFNYEKLLQDILTDYITQTNALCFSLLSSSVSLSFARILLWINNIWAAPFITLINHVDWWETFEANQVKFVTYVLHTHIQKERVHESRYRLFRKHY